MPAPPSQPLPTAALRDRLSQLRMQLLSAYPFWGTLLCEVDLLWSASLPTFAATNGVDRIWLHPELCALLAPRQLGFVVLHELYHIVYETLGREQNRQRGLWNRASDYAINRQVAALGRRDGYRWVADWQAPEIELPGLGRVQILRDGRFDSLPAEAIYVVLGRQPQQAVAQGPAVELPDCQGGTALSDPDHRGGVDVHVPLVGSAEAQQARRDAATERLARVAQAAKDLVPGPLPLDLDRWLGELRPGQQDWQALLRRYLSEVGAAVERSWQRPHRRWLTQAPAGETWLVPGPLPEADGCVVLAIDTSGSMRDGHLQAIASELAALDDRVSELWLVCADAKVQAVLPPGQLRGFLAQRKLPGGGGTDHRPLFEWLARQPFRPEVVLCYTDLQTTLPERGPGCPVLWLVPKGAQVLARPGFGVVVRV